MRTRQLSVFDLRQRLAVRRGAWRGAGAFLALLLAVVCFARPLPAGSQAKTPDVILQIDTGGHRGTVNALIFSKDGRTLYSAGQDKIVRQWDWRSGATLATFRGEIGQAYHGSIHAIALSPDEKLLAVGGRMRADCSGGCGDVRLFDTTTGKLAGVLVEPGQGTVASLAFSADGRRLAAGGYAGKIAIWDPVARRRIHLLEGHTGTVGELAFIGASQRLVSASGDATWRVWDVGSGTTVRVNAEHTAPVNALAVSPADPLIATGGDDRSIMFWHAETGETVYKGEPDIGSIAALAFTPDGHHLVAGVGVSMAQSAVFDIKTGKPPVGLEGATVVSAVAVSPDGLTVALALGDTIELREIASGRVIGRLAGRGRPKVAVGFDEAGNLAWGSDLNRAVVAELIAEMAPRRALAGISDTDVGVLLTILIGAARPEELAVLARPDMRRKAEAIFTPGLLSRVGGLDTFLRLPKPGGHGLAGQLGVPRKLPAERAEGFTRTQSQRGAFEARGAWGGMPPSPVGRLAVFKDGKLHKQGQERSGACGLAVFTLAGSEERPIVIRSGCDIAQYDIDGNFTGAFAGHEQRVGALAIAPDGILLASGSGDQTVRLWHAVTRELIASIFIATDGEWIIWTPQGYYATSARGDRFVGWHVNRGPDREARYVTAEQLKSHFFRPDIVARAIELRSASAAVREAREADPDALSFSLADLVRREPPEFRVLSIDKTDGAFADVTIEVEGGEEPVRDVSVLVNETQVTPATLRGTAPFASASRHTIRVPLRAGANAVSVTVENAVGRTRRGTVILRTSNQEPRERRGTLYIVAIGVDDYRPNAGLASLRFAGADARAFRDRVAATLGAEHRETKSLLLSHDGDMAPTSSNVRRALRFFRQAGPDDTTVLFLAGHGVQDGPDYFFMPTNATRDALGWDPDSVVLWSTLEANIARTEGRRLLFIDTCRSGGAYNARLVKDTFDAGVIAFSATNAEAVAEERADLGHGVFTFALLEGLAGAADVFPVAAPDGAINMYELAAFVSDTVARLTNNAQRPELNARKFADFVVARASQPMATPAR